MTQGIDVGSALLWTAVLWLCEGQPAGEPPAAFEAGLATITAGDLEKHARALSGPELEGRDSPGAGLELAARYIEGELKAAGLEPLGGDLGYRLPFTQRAPAPVAGGCALVLAEAEGERPFALGVDFVPVAYCGGAAEGELVFAGFGIRASSEHYDDLCGRGLEGALAVIVEGEPRHPRRFEGEELSAHATLWTKLAALAEEHVAGVLVVRRPLAAVPPPGAGPEGSAPAGLAFRHDFATWATESMTPVPAGLPKDRVPAAEITPACAEALLGFDVLAEVAELDRTGRAAGTRASARRARLSVATEEQGLRVDNVAGLVRGSDPARAGEIVVIGAHYDHVGVDDRGRIGLGADDNASGTAALLELARALAEARPARSVACVAFGGEEDGLLGSAAFCERPPWAGSAGGTLTSMVAMLNMDMVGRGSRDEVAVIGIDQNPDLGEVLKRAQRFEPSGVKRLVTRGGAELWQRSDHFSFHEAGVPVLFFFEGLPISDNPDYHTWRDTLERLDFDKIARTTRLVYNTAWLLANDATKPDPPRD